MKNLFSTRFIILIILAGFTIKSCKKESVPSVETVAITSVDGTSATGGGTITSEGSSPVTSRGVCWSTGLNPTLDDNKTSDGQGAGTFESNLTGLNPATTYYARAYATNNNGTGYGVTASFTTRGDSPVTISQPVTNITEAAATLNAIVNANYLSTTVSFDYGTTTDYGSSITAVPGQVEGNVSENVSGELSGLDPGTTYHFRIKAVNALGTTYSDDLEFTTFGSLPTAVTRAACCLSSTGARLNGTVNANCLSTLVTFEYGLTSSYGSYAEAVQNPVTGTAPVSVSAYIPGLNPATIYHFRIKAVNSIGTVYGEDLFFSTLP